ncbi:MAG: putative signal transducing protein [Solimonas sp.]
MSITSTDLRRNYEREPSDRLLALHAGGTLTDLAQEIVEQILTARGVALARPGADTMADTAAAAAGGNGPLVRVGRYLDYAEAQVLLALLESEGIPAILADAHLATANNILSTATGGVRLLVHESNLARADEVAAAHKRGDYAIDEDFDVGEPGVS